MKEPTLFDLDQYNSIGQRFVAADVGEAIAPQRLRVLPDALTESDRQILTLDDPRWFTSWLWVCEKRGDRILVKITKTKKQRGFSRTELTDHSFDCSCNSCCSPAESESAGEQIQTCSPAESESAGEQTQTCSPAESESAGEQTQTCSPALSKTKPYGWVEVYSPSTKPQHQYYRYGYVANRRTIHTHLCGGNINSPEACRLKQEVEEAIANKRSPLEIVALIKGLW